MSETGSRSARSPHLDDAALVRLLDDAPDADVEPLRRHAAECSTCARRLERLQRQSHAVSAQLRLADPAAIPPFVPAGEAPPRRSGVPWLRAAAVLLVTAGVLHAADRVRDRRARPEDAPRDPAPPTQTVTAAANTLRFSVAGNAVRIRFARRQPGGTLELRSEASTQAVFTGPAAGVEEARVSEHGLEIDNRAEVAGAYRLAVPRGTHVSVLIGGERHAVTTAGAPVLLSLDR